MANADVERRNSVFGTSGSSKGNLVRLREQREIPTSKSTGAKWLHLLHLARMAWVVNRWLKSSKIND